MNDQEKLTALKKAYADTILNTTKEAAARVMMSEKKAREYQHELSAVKDEALRTCLRLKQMYDSKVKEAEIVSLKNQQKIEELEAQLGEAEDIVEEVRTELRQSNYLLEKLTKDRQISLGNKEKNASEAVPVSLEVREDSSNHEMSVTADGIKPHMTDRDFSINRCSNKENKDPCLHALPSILSRRKEGEMLERSKPGGDCANVESLTEARKEEGKETGIELSTTPLSEKPCIKFSYSRKRKKDGRNSSSSGEGGSSSSQEDDDDEIGNKRQKTSKKDNCYLDSFNSTEPSRDNRRISQLARQLLPFSEKKVLQQSQCDDVP